MNSPGLEIVLGDHAGSYEPGEVLSGCFSLHGMAAQEVRAVELSVLWHTEGKGDEDMSVHFFERIEPRSGELVGLRQPRPFNTVLPNSPLSYDGMIVKICWCVRVRVFLARGKELTQEAPFQLGAVPHPQPVTA